MAIIAKLRSSPIRMRFVSDGTPQSYSTTLTVIDGQSMVRWHSGGTMRPMPGTWLIEIVAPPEIGAEIRLINHPDGSMPKRGDMRRCIVTFEDDISVRIPTLATSPGEGEVHLTPL